MSNEIWNAETEGAPPQELTRRQVKLLRQHLDTLAAHSPHYRGLQVPDSGGDPHSILASLPTISKSEIVARQLEAPPYGDFLAIEPGEVTRAYVHPGPQAFAWTRDDEELLADMYAMAAYAAGIRAGDIVDLIFQYHWVAGGTQWDAGIRRLGAAAVPGGAGGTVTHVTNMALLTVTGVVGFPSFLEHLAEVARDIGLDPATDLGVRKLVLAGEMHSPATRARLAEAYGGAAVHEVYGTAETGLVAGECAEGGGMHVHPDVVVEVRDLDNGELIEHGPGEIYVTHLRLRSMPVLRFRTHDVTAGIDRAPCPCGRTTPRLGPIVARTGGIVRVKGVFLFPSKIAEIMQVQGFLRHQLIIDRHDGLDMIVASVEGEGSEAARTRLADAIRAEAKVTVDVRFVVPRTIEADAPAVVDRRDLSRPEASRNTR